MRLPFPIMACALVYFSCGTTQPPVPAPAPMVVDQWAKHMRLVGEWMDTTTSKYHFHESWRRLNDTTLTGAGYVLSGHDTISVEELRLTRDGEFAEYAARMGSQNGGNWTAFRSCHSAEDSLVFENATHDWPQHIAYVADSAGYSVSVSGTQDDAFREERFRFVARK